MISAEMGGGSQWESNDSSAQVECKLQNPVTDTADKTAKQGCDAYSGVQPKARANRLTIPEWAKQQRSSKTALVALDWSRVGASKDADWTASELERIFCPTAPSTLAAQDLMLTMSTLLYMGVLKSRSVTVPYACTKSSLAKLDWKYLRKHPSESEEHRILKFLGICWLRSIGADRAASEMDCGFGRADSYSPDLDIAVECGNTNPERIHAVLSGSLRAMLILPYKRENGDSYEGVIFCARKGGLNG